MHPNSSVEKITILLIANISFIHLFIVAVDAALNGFLRATAGLSDISTSRVYCLEIYSL